MSTRKKKTQTPGKKKPQAKRATKKLAKTDLVFEGDNTERTEVKVQATPLAKITNPFVKPVQDAVKQMMLQREAFVQGERKGQLGSTQNAYWGQRVEIALQDLYLNLYRRHAWVRSAVNKIARALMGSKFEVVPSDNILSTGRVPDARQRLVMNSLFEQPNPDETTSFLTFWAIAKLIICGEVFFEVELDNSDVPRHIYTLQGRVLLNADPYTGEKFEPHFLQFTKPHVADEPAVEFFSDEVIHIINPNPIGGIRGHSDMESLELVLLTDILAQEFNKNIFTNAGKRTMIFQLQKGLGHEEAERNREEIKQHYQGVATAHSPALVIEGEVTLKELEEKLSDLEFMEGRQMNRQEVLSVIGVPPNKLGIPDKGLDEAQSDAMFSKETVRAYNAIFLDGINHAMFVKFGITDWVVRLNYAQVRDERRVARLIEILAKRGVATINENRAFIGLPRIDGGDRIVMYNPKHHVFADPFDPDNLSQLPEPAEIVAPNPEQGVNVEESESSLKNVIRDMFGDGASLEEIADAIADEFEDEELGEVAPDFFSLRDVESVTKKLNTDLASDISKIEKRVMNAVKNVALSSHPGITQKIIPSGAFRVSTVAAIRRGYIAGQRDLAKKLNSKVTWTLVPKSEFSLIKARSARVARKLQKDLFQGEAKSGRLGVKRALDRAAANRWTKEKLVAQLEKYFKDGKTWKVEQIARTEVARAYHMGMAKAARKLGHDKAYIELGAKPCDWCSTNATTLGTNSLDAVMDFFAAHHPNPDCSLVILQPGDKKAPSEKKEPAEFKPRSNLWMSHLNGVVSESSSVTSLEEKAWVKLKDFESNIYLLTRSRFAKTSDTKLLETVLKSLDGVVVSSEIFELLNSVEFHDKLPGGAGAKYIPETRGFQLSRDRKEDWSGLWTELVGELLYDGLSLRYRNLRVVDSLSAVFPEVSINSVRSEIENIKMERTNFSVCFRIYYEDAALLSKKVPSIYNLIDHIINPFK